MQMHTVSLKLLQTCCTWQKEVKKEYYFGPVLCKVWSRELMNTRETSAILCWLRRGDMLGSRRNAKLHWASHLFCLFHTISEVRVILLPLESFPLFSLVYSHDCHFLHPPLLSGHALYYFPPSLPHSLPIWAPGDLNLPLTSWCVRSV